MSKQDWLILVGIIAFYGGWMWLMRNPKWSADD